MLVVLVVATLNHVNQVHTVQSYGFRIHFCSSLLSMPRTSMSPSFQHAYPQPCRLTASSAHSLHTTLIQLPVTPDSCPAGLLLTPCAYHSSLVLVGLLLTLCTSVVSCSGWPTADTVCKSVVSCSGSSTADTVHINRVLF